MQPDDDRRTRLAVLSAVEAALADPVRLVRIGLDQQYRSLTRASRTRLAEDLHLLREPWDEPVEAALVVARGSAVLTVDSGERTFRERGEHRLLDAVRQHLVEEVARPRLRPVTVTTSGLARGPAVITVMPDGSMSLDDPVDGGPPG